MTVNSSIFFKFPVSKPGLRKSPRQALVIIVPTQYVVENTKLVRQKNEKDQTAEGLDAIWIDPV